jgi:hypothetical protein
MVIFVGRYIFVGLNQADENKTTLNPAVTRFESDLPNLATRRSPAARRPSPRPLLTAARPPSAAPCRARSSPPPAPRRRQLLTARPLLTAARTPVVRGVASNLSRPSNSNPPRLRTRAVDVLPRPLRYGRLVIKI